MYVYTYVIPQDDMYAILVLVLSNMHIEFDPKMALYDTDIIE